MPYDQEQIRTLREFLQQLRTTNMQKAHLARELRRELTRYLAWTFLDEGPENHSGSICLLCDLLMSKWKELILVRYTMESLFHQIE